MATDNLNRNHGRECTLPLYLEPLPVCKVPLSGPYDHVGTAKYIDDEGVIHDEREEQDDSGGLLQSLTSTVGSISAISAKLVRGMPDDYLTDHAPIFYAVHVWNNYVRS